MAEWATFAIISNDDGFGGELSYEKAMLSLAKRFPNLISQIKMSVDKNLISLGYKHLITDVKI